MKRVLLLTDDEITLALGWGEVAKSLENVAEPPADLVLHDWEEDDEQLREKLEHARLKA